MVKKETIFNAGIGMSPELAAELARRASKYDAHVLLRCGGRELRLDSLIGILSAEMPRGSKVTVEADGRDAQAAAEDIVRVLIGS